MSLPAIRASPGGISAGARGGGGASVGWRICTPVSPPLTELSCIPGGAGVSSAKFAPAILLQNAFEAVLARLARIPRRIGYARDGRGTSFRSAGRRRPLYKRQHKRQHENHPFSAQEIQSRCSKDALRCASGMGVTRWRFAGLQFARRVAGSRFDTRRHLVGHPQSRLGLAGSRRFDTLGCR
jgi:hypothetical protein